MTSLNVSREGAYSLNVEVAVDNPLQNMLRIKNNNNVSILMMSCPVKVSGFFESFPVIGYGFMHVTPRETLREKSVKIASLIGVDDAGVQKEGPNTGDLVGSWLMWAIPAIIITCLFIIILYLLMTKKIGESTRKLFANQNKQGKSR